MYTEQQLAELMKTWSLKCADTPEELIKQYAHYFVEAKDNNPTQTDDFLQKYALSRISGSLRRQFSSTAKKFVGLIVTYGNLYNASKKVIERAMTENWYDDKGQLVYKDYDWRMNKPIPKEDWQRLVTGVAVLDDGKATQEVLLESLKQGKGVPFTMFVKKEMNLPTLNTFVSFRATLKEDQLANPTWTLGATSVTEFKVKGEVPQVIGLDLIGAKYFPKNCFSLSSLPLQNPKDLGAAYDFIITFGTVARITITNENKKSNVLELADMDNFVVEEVFLSKNIPIDFAEGSVAFVIGSVSQDQKEPGKIIGINSTGLWLKVREAPEVKPEIITPTNIETKTDVEIVTPQQAKQWV